MIIKEHTAEEIKRKKKLKKILFLKRIMLPLILGLIIIAGFVASRKVKEKGYANLADFLTTVSSNYFNGIKANPESISIEIKEKDLKVLRKNREQALERGVIINDMDGEYVPAQLEFHGKKMKIKMRLKGHMTDHLQENKWSFRIKIKDKDSFMGMKRFSVQHPGTRGYIYEWIYHELMKRENIIALRYKFINVSLNGKNWGIYAVEENFEKELIDNNKRNPGPILRFNPDMYWVHRYNLMKGQTAPDEFASYYSANPEAYREDEVLKDSVLTANYMKALALIEGVRSKTITVHDAFDIKLLAKFHAIIDLVGGQHAIDWSDIKYYYNASSSKLEPIAYESFSSFPIKELSGMYKYVAVDSVRNYEDWHTALFSDPVFFKEYVKQLEYISSPEYLTAFFEETKIALNENLDILNKEFPYKKFDRNLYAINQKKIRQMINPPQALLAYTGQRNGNKIHILAGNTESLPIEIKALIINQQEIKPDAPIIIAAKQPNSFIDYKDYSFDLPLGFKLDKDAIASMKISYSVLGASVLKQQPVFPFEHPSFTSYDVKNNTIQVPDWVKVDEKNKMLILQKGIHALVKDFLVPKGYKVLMLAGTAIDFKNNSRMITNSPVFCQGNEMDPVVFKSTDSTDGGITIFGAMASKFEYTKFIQLGNSEKKCEAIIVNKSDAVFRNCNFEQIKADAIHLIDASAIFDGCLFSQINGNSLTLDVSKSKIVNTAFEDCKSKAINAVSSLVSMKDVYFKNVSDVAMSLKKASQLNGQALKLKNINEAVFANGKSVVKLDGVQLENAQKAFSVDKVVDAQAYSIARVSGLKAKNVGVLVSKSNYSEVTIDNKKM